MFNFLSCQLTTPHAKQGRKLREDSMHLDLRYNTKKLSLRKQTDPLKSKSKGDYSFPPGKELRRTTKQQPCTEEMNGAVLSSISCTPVELQQVSTFCEGKYELPQNAEPNLGREHLLSSCGSVVTKPALSDSQVSSRGEELVNWVSLNKDMISANSRMSTKNSKISEGNLEINFNCTKVNIFYHFGHS